MKSTRRTWLIGSLAAPALAQSGLPAPISMPRTIRLGLIGYDGHVEEILRVLPQLPDVTLSAVAEAGSDPMAVKSHARNRYFAKAQKYGTAAEMLSNEKLDVAAICNNDGE
ncbi:MAG: hypothetical protein M3Z36_15080, partial [Acidobacteriota bacterium]|nr:hypothetical protein [Acidobacteriota bacterium]